jgi:hypothetical protein
VAKMYFIGGPDASRGPYDAERLQDMIVDGRLRPRDLVLGDGTDEWLEGRARPGRHFRFHPKCAPAFRSERFFNGRIL